MKTSRNPVIAYFISAHGFGHAARASAVIEAVHRVAPAARFEIFTTIPQWFFTDFIQGPFACHRLETDVGMIQKSPLEEDLPATCKALEAFYPLDGQRISAVAEQVKSLGCRAVICDIAPMGIAVARKAGLLSVLVENFTWDWIYAGYEKHLERLQPHIDYLEEVFAGADFHIQATPACAPCSPDLTVAPVSRVPRLSAGRIRERLEIPGHLKLVIITLGGAAVSQSRLKYDDLPEDLFLVVPGISDKIQRSGRTLLLPARSGIYHPDLLRAADVVIGKTGYSTLAEIYQADVPFGYVSRRNFREAPVMETFVREKMRSLEVSETALKNGSWATRIQPLVSLPPSGESRVNGAVRIAEFMVAML